MVINKGFSLVELMVSVAIMGILAAVAVPQYSQYVAKGNRSEAMRELVVVANLQEQFLIENRSYTTDMTELGFDTDPFLSEKEKYSIDVEAVSDISIDFIIVATALAGQLSNDASCVKLRIDHLGQKSSVNSADVDTTDICWGK